MRPGVSGDKTQEEGELDKCTPESKTGKCKFGGWSRQGMTRFNDLFNHVTKSRCTPAAALNGAANIPPASEYGDMLQEPKADAEDDTEFETFDQYLNADFMVNANGEPAMA